MLRKEVEKLINEGIAKVPVGQKGDKGDTGSQGPQGIQGNPGNDGKDGITTIIQVNAFTDNLPFINLI